MRKSKWLAPYTKNNKTIFSKRNVPGVYLIKRRSSGEILYVGFSGTNLYKTMYRHFQYWNHPSQPVVTYYGQDRYEFLVRVIYCTPKQAASLETMLIIKYKPTDNIQKLELIAERSNYEKQVLESYYTAGQLTPERSKEEVPF